MITDLRKIWQLVSAPMSCAVLASVRRGMTDPRNWIFDEYYAEIIDARSPLTLTRVAVDWRAIDHLAGDNELVDGLHVSDGRNRLVIFTTPENRNWFTSEIPTGYKGISQSVGQTVTHTVMIDLWNGRIDGAWRWR
jgi:hypothetical protein